MYFRYLFLLSLVPFLTSGLLPPLPPLPIPSPLPTPSPSPLLPSPSPAVPSPSFPPKGPPITPGVSPPPLSPTPSKSSSPTPSLADSVDPKECRRDESDPKPRLGRSQQRYAMAVLGSAGAVGIASLLYNGAYAWIPKRRYAVCRVILIIMARLLIVSAIKLSAALVASITKASPRDGALDASGAFLTWGSAIFLRLYSEGIIMTTTALGYVHKQSVWVHKLKEFLNTRKKSSSNDNDPAEQSLPTVRAHAVVPNLERGEQRSPNENGPEEQSRSHDVDPGLNPNKVSVWKCIFGGRWERTLLVLTAIIYFMAEVSLLVTNVLSLVGSFDPRSEVTIISDDLEGQCPLNGDDKREVALITVLHCLYELTNQPSLVPILTVCTLLRKRLRLFACLVLVIWVTALSVLPHRHGILEPMFTTGDFSLFWYVMLAPPVYSDTSYIITMTYTSLAALVGFVLIYRLPSIKVAQKH